MSLKHAAFLALVGVGVLTLMLAMDFINTVIRITSDVLPMMALPRSLVYVLASLCLTVFLFVFHKQQS